MQNILFGQVILIFCCISYLAFYAAMVPLIAIGAGMGGCIASLH